MDTTTQIIKKMPLKSKHYMYGAWVGMIGRCHNPKHSSYFQYGAKGIVVVERWRKFENFLTDMGDRPNGCSLDRIDPFGPYAPWNCRWATAKEQRQNLSAEGAERQRAGASEGAKKRWANTPRATKPPKGKYKKLTLEDVIKIRRIGHTQTQTEIGKLFGVSHRTIGLILSGKTWSQM